MWINKKYIILLLEISGNFFQNEQLKPDKPIYLLTKNQKP